MPTRWVQQPVQQSVFGVPGAGYFSFRNTYAEAVMKLNPTAYWPLSELVVGVLTDVTGRYSGTTSAGTYGQVPIHRSPGRSMTQTSSGNNGTSAVLPAMSTWSMACWSKSITVSNFNIYLSFGPPVGGTLVRFGSGSGEINVSEGLGWSALGIGHAIGEVIHLTATFDGATCRVYKNGVFATNAPRVNIALGSAAWSITSDNGGANIQDVSIWDRVLTATEISTLYQSGK